MSEPDDAEDGWSAGTAAGFIDQVSMEDDPAELFAGDAGTLDADVRRVHAEPASDSPRQHNVEGVRTRPRLRRKEPPTAGRK